MLERLTTLAYSERFESPDDLLEYALESYEDYGEAIGELLEHFEGLRDYHEQVYDLIKQMFIEYLGDII